MEYVLPNRSERARDKPGQPNRMAITGPAHTLNSLHALDFMLCGPRAKAKWAAAGAFADDSVNHQVPTHPSKHPHPPRSEEHFAGKTGLDVPGRPIVHLTSHRGNEVKQRCESK